MAEHYTELSFEFVLSDPDSVGPAVRRMRELSEAVLEGGNVPELLEPYTGEDAGIAIEAGLGHVCVYDTGAAHTDLVITLVQQILREFDPEQGVGFEWSYSCSKPLRGCFGGGVAWVTADAVEVKGTSELLRTFQTEWLGRKLAEAAP